MAAVDSVGFKSKKKKTSNIFFSNTELGVAIFLVNYGIKEN